MLSLVTFISYASSMHVDSTTFQRNSFWGNIQIWTEMGKQKLQAKKVCCLGYAKGFSGRSRKGGRGGGGFQGGYPLLKWTYKWPEMFLVIYWLFALKLKLLPLKDHIEDILYVYSTNTDDGWKWFRGK